MKFPVQPSETSPPREAVVTLVGFWIIWLILIGALVIREAPVIEPRWIYAPICLLFIPFIFGVLWDQSLIRSKSATWTKRQHSRNMWATVITLLTTAVGFAILYHVSWYPDRIRKVIEFSQDSLENATFPSITLFQRANWSSQAALKDQAGGKCFIGWHNESASNCSDVAPGTTTCQCTESWGDETVTDFTWMNTTFRTLTLKSTPSMISLIPTTQMIVQTFFTYNTAKANADSSHILSPGLWIAIYDQTLTLQEALEYGYTRMSLINANGIVAINLGINYKKPLNQPPAFDYPLSFSVVPSTEIECDPSSDNGGKCFLSLFLQFPTFDRLSFTNTVAMGPVDLVLAAGSWFALFQLLGWILSGMAFHPR